MKYSNKIKSRQTQLKYTKLVGQAVAIDLSHFNLSLRVFYEIDMDQRLRINGVDKILEEPYGALLDALLELIDGNPVGGLNRVGSKELDHFLRDDPKTPAVEFYSPKFLSLFNITSKLYEHLSGITDKENLKIDGFVDLSFSEQVDYFEEFLSFYIYPDPLFSEREFELENVVDKKLIIRVSGEQLSDIFYEKLQNCFGLARDFIVVDYTDSV